MDSTARITEQMALIGKIDPSSSVAEQNSGSILVANYHRVVCLIQIGDIGSSGTVDADLEQQATSGGTPKAITGKSITQLTDAGADDNKVVAIELDCDELDVDGGYEYINLELTCAVGASLVGALIFGLPRFKPAVATGFDEVVD